MFHPGAVDEVFRFLDEFLLIRDRSADILDESVHGNDLFLREIGVRFLDISALETDLAEERIEPSFDEFVSQVFKSLLRRIRNVVRQYDIRDAGLEPVPVGDQL